MNDEFSISDVITSIRSELENIDEERRQNRRQPLLEVEKVSIELGFIVTNKSQIGGGLSLKVITADAKSEEIQNKLQKIKIDLKIHKSGSSYPLGALAGSEDGKAGRP